MALIEIEELRLDRGAGLAIEIASRLIGQDELRLHEKGPREGNPLLLATGELARPVGQARREPYFVEEIAGAALEAAPPLDAAGHQHDFEGGELGQ